MPGYKRKSSGGSRYVSKKRRLNRRRYGKFRRSGRRVTTVSGQSGSIRNNGFRSRRTSHRRWRNILWTSTLPKQHWRSVKSVSSTQNTQSSPDLVDIITAQAMPDNFWTTAEGLQPAETGVAAPTGFTGDLVLRGGKASISFSNIGNADTADAIRIRLWMVWTIKEPAAILPTIPVPTAWDPSLIPDFGRLGKVIGHREFFIVPGNVPMEVSFFFKPQKIDRAIFNAGGETLSWFWAANGLNTGADSYVVQQSSNLSFTGDVLA